MSTFFFAKDLKLGISRAYDTFIKHVFHCHADTLRSRCIASVSREHIIADSDKMS